MPLNLYKPPDSSLAEADYHLETPAEQYDVNYVWPVPDKLSTPGGVSLVPLIPSLHAGALHDLLNVQFPSLWSHLPGGPFNTLSAFLTWLERFRQTPEAVFFVVQDLSRPSHPIAGLVGLIASSPTDRLTEFGPVIVFPPFQRTHVLSHSAALLLRYCFDDLGLRRVQWSANAANEGSEKACLRLGFKKEGVARWHKVLPANKGVADGGVPLPKWAEEAEARAGRGLGRHTTLLAMSFVDWKDTVRDLTDALTSRAVLPRSD